MSMATPAPPRPRGSVTEEKSECRGLIKTHGLGRHCRPFPGGFINQASCRSQEIHLNSYHNCSLLARGATSLTDCPCPRARRKWAKCQELRSDAFVSKTCVLCASPLFSLLPCDRLHAKWYINWKHFYFNILKHIPWKRKLRERAHLNISHPGRGAQQGWEGLASYPFLWLDKETLTIPTSMDGHGESC